MHARPPLTVVAAEAAADALALVEQPRVEEPLRPGTGSPPTH